MCRWNDLNASVYEYFKLQNCIRIAGALFARHWLVLIHAAFQANLIISCVCCVCLCVYFGFVSFLLLCCSARSWYFYCFPLFAGTHRRRIHRGSKNWREKKNSESVVYVILRLCQTVDSAVYFCSDKIYFYFSRRILFFNAGVHLMIFEKNKNNDLVRLVADPVLLLAAPKKTDLKCTNQIPSQYGQTKGIWNWRMDIRRKVTVQTIKSIQCQMACY